MNKIEVLMTVANSILLLALVVQWVVMVKQKKENDNLVEWLNKCADKLAKTNTELTEYKIIMQKPIEMPRDATPSLLDKTIKELFIYKPPYNVGQRVSFNDEGFVRVGYIHSIRTEQYEITQGDTDKKEVVVRHAYEMGSKFYTDIIGVVKEDK